MIIPTSSDIHGFAADLANKCFSSYKDRETTYRRQRNYYLKGTGNGRQSKLNRLLPHIQLQSSFLYSGETTSFNIDCGAELDEILSLQSLKFADIIQDYWREEEFDTSIQDATTMSLVYGKAFIKVIPNGNSATPYYCSPLTIGVYREDISSLRQQECIVQKYQITRSELRRNLKISGKTDSQIDNLMNYASLSAETDIEENTNDQAMTLSYPVAMPGDQIQPAGGVFDINALGDRNYIPAPNNDLVTMYEIWVWDNDLNDYRVLTATSSFVVMSRPNIFIPKEIPFVDFCSNRIPDYFWGISEVETQIGLQLWIDERLAQIQKAFKMQIDPPLVATMITNFNDEYSNFWKPGGKIVTNDPQGSIKPIITNTAPNAYQEISNFTEFMNDLAGINDMLQGKGTSGVRAEGHAAMIARISSTTQKNRALLIEKSVERVATLLGKCLYMNDDTIYSVKYQNETLKFALSQFIPDFRVRVNNHSQSPLFGYDIEQNIYRLMEMGDIPKELLIKNLNLPNKDDIIAYLKNKKAPSPVQVAEAVKELKTVEAQEKAAAVLNLVPKK